MFPEASNNMAVAASLGLVNPMQPQHLPEVEDVDEAQRKFKVACVTNDEPANDAIHIYTEPMCGGVLSEAGTYDNKAKDVLFVRVSSAGMQSTVQTPIKIDEYNVEIPVQRKNMPDLIEQLIPTGNADVKKAFRDKVETQLKNNYGAHCDYDVFNSAFKAMVPADEGWTVNVSVQPPFQFAKMSETLFLASPGAVDAFVVFRLLRE